MTGDGVNDVMALKRANLGIAMQSGSQAARGVSDIILLNDSFAVLPETFAEGQRILVGMADILKLYLTRILSLALLITAVAVLGAGFPFTATQNSLIYLITLSVPALGLALWARPERVPRGNLTRRLMHFVLPATIITTIAGLAVYVYFYASTGGDYHYAQQTLTYSMVAMGLLLVVFVEPPTGAWAGGDVVSRDWRPTLLAVGMLAAFLVLLAVPPLREMYDLVPLWDVTDYLVIAAIIAIWAVALRLMWRTRLVDRYLSVDLGGEAAASG
jgi:cation-transporting ATPase E